MHKDSKCARGSIHATLGNVRTLGNIAFLAHVQLAHLKACTVCRDVHAHMGRRQKNYLWHYFSERHECLWGETVRKCAQLFPFEWLSSLSHLYDIRPSRVAVRTSYKDSWPLGMAGWHTVRTSLFQANPALQWLSMCTVKKTLNLGITKSSYNKTDKRTVKSSCHGHVQLQPICEPL